MGQDEDFYLPACHKPNVGVNAMRLLTTIILITLTIPVCGQGDTTFYTFHQLKNLKDKAIVEKLTLTDAISAMQTLPTSIRDCKNLKFLSLRPRITAFGRPRDGGVCIHRYAKVKLSKLPDWITDFSNLTELDLIGQENLDYVKELNKIQMFKGLTSLSLDPREINDALVDKLTTMTNLKSLKIRAALSDNQLLKLKTSLPNTSIVTGIYADY
jgi:hypothetical protein